MRRASLFYHTWQHERSFVWAWSASCGTNRSFKAFVKFIRKRLNQGSQIGWFPKKIANGSFFTGTGVKTAQSPGRSERNSRGARAYLMMPRIRHERCARRASFGGAARVLAQLARFACCRQPGRAKKHSERAKTREIPGTTTPEPHLASGPTLKMPRISDATRGLVRFGQRTSAP